MSASQRARKRRISPRNAHSRAPTIASDTNAVSNGVPPIQSALPAITFGQLKLLAAADTPLVITIRQSNRSYRVECEIGPRRWALVSTHTRCPRVFRHLDGAAHAIQKLRHARIALILNAPDKEV